MSSTCSRCAREITRTPCRSHTRRVSWQRTNTASCLSSTKRARAPLRSRAAAAFCWCRCCARRADESSCVSARAAICGGDDLRAAAAVLGLEPCDAGRPDVVLVDLRDASACAAAAALDSAIPRVAVAGESERALAAALGYDASSIASTCEAAALGPLVVATVRAAGSLAELVLVDAPVLADERGLALASRAERVLVLSYDDPLSLATLDAVDLPNAAWLVASQSRTARVGERAAFRALPRDETAVGAALSGRRGAGGALGRAYDELAELIALDAS